MHNRIKILLFRYLLILTYLPALILFYPFLFFRKKRLPNLVFVFDRFSLGGAQVVHLDILNSVSSKKKAIFFSQKSVNNHFKDNFLSISNVEIIEDISKYCTNLFFRTFYTHYFSFFINISKCRKIFSSNSTFFYDNLYFIDKNIIKIELLHNFTFGKDGMEYFGLLNYKYLNYRIVVDKATKANIFNQYKKNNIDNIYYQRVKIAEPGIEIGYKNSTKNTFKNNLEILYCGRGGIQKRVWLVNKIAEYCYKNSLLVKFTFAGSMQQDLSEFTKLHCNVLGLLNSKDELYSIYSNSDLLILTSAYEGFPMVIKEAMANGCVPFVTALDGNKSHLKNLDNSILIYEILNEDELVKEAINKIKQILENKIDLDKIKQRAYEYAKINFSKEPFYTFYKELLL